MDITKFFKKIKEEMQKELKVCFFLFLCIFFKTTLFVQSAELVEDFPYNPYVCPGAWAEARPYFLPFDHPIKAKLDSIFKKRVLLNEQSLEKAGFVPPKIRSPNQIVVLSHPHLKNYLIKAYLESQPVTNEWQQWIKRIQGANLIRETIERHEFKKFKVPKKWIYPLPSEPSPPSHFTRKNFILIVENMHILKPSENKKAYKKWMNQSDLDALYTILSEVGLYDSTFIDNIPMTKRGEIAFIDTEHYHGGPIKYRHLKKYFPHSLQNYWMHLIQDKENEKKW